MGKEEKNGGEVAVKPRVPAKGERKRDVRDKVGKGLAVATVVGFVVFLWKGRDAGTG